MGRCNATTQAKVLKVNEALETVSVPPCSDMTIRDGGLKAVAKSIDLDVVVEIERDGLAFIRLENCKPGAPQNPYGRCEDFQERIAFGSVSVANLAKAITVLGGRVSPAQRRFNPPQRPTQHVSQSFETGIPSNPVLYGIDTSIDYYINSYVPSVLGEFQCNISYRPTRERVFEATVNCFGTSKGGEERGQRVTISKSDQCGTPRNPTLFDCGLNVGRFMQYDVPRSLTNYNCTQVSSPDGLWLHALCTGEKK